MVFPCPEMICNFNDLYMINIPHSLQLKCGFLLQHTFGIQSTCILVFVHSVLKMCSLLCRFTTEISFSMTTTSCIVTLWNLDTFLASFIGDGFK